MKNELLLVPALAFVCGIFSGTNSLQGQSFSSFPAGDDVTTSLGQFQVVLDQAWVKIFDLIMANSPLSNTMATRHLKVYRHGGIFTSPTLYDPATTIGRSASLLSGGPEDTIGVLAGRAPGRTYIKDSQLTVRPNWNEPTNGSPEIHTFLKSMHLSDVFTTRIGFSVKAGMQAPTRPVSAGQVEVGSPTSDFPANSFFNVDPLLVQQTNIFSLPPRIVYQHENSSAVSMYFNTDVTIPDPINGGDIHVTRGTLFGQLTLAGHGVGFGENEIESFQNEIETESETAPMPVNPLPITSVQIQDFSPDYNAAAPTIVAAHFLSDGSFAFTITNAPANTTNYVQVSAEPVSINWQTIGTIVPTTNSFDFIDPNITQQPRRFYRWTAVP